MWSTCRDVLTGGCSTNKVDILIRSLIVPIYVVKINITKQNYLYWQTEDKKTLKKINQLINDIVRNGNDGLGKPEPLNGNLSGFWSRRINDKDRMIYRIDDNNIYSCVSLSLWR